MKKLDKFSTCSKILLNLEHPGSLMYTPGIVIIIVLNSILHITTLNKYYAVMSLKVVTVIIGCNM